MNLRINQNLANLNTVKSFVNWATKNDAANYKKLQKYYPTAFMLLTIGIGQTGFILASDDMPKKRRIPLALNNTINCLISLAGAALIAKHSEKLTNKFVERAKVIFPKERHDQIVNGIKTAIPMTITAFLFKYIGQVIAIPITDKVNKYLIKKGIVDYSDKKEGLTKK